MRDGTEKPYYGFNAVRYIALSLSGVGIIVIASAAVFTVFTYPIWAVILCWFLGALFLITGILWHLLMGFAVNPRKVELLQRDFLQRLERLWNGKGKVLDIGTGQAQDPFGQGRLDPAAPPFADVGQPLGFRGQGRMLLFL